MELFKHANYDFLGKKVPFIGASVVLLIAGFISLGIKGGPAYGIDFRSGTQTYVKFLHSPSEDEIRKALAGKIAGAVTVQVVYPASTNEVIISTEVRSEKELEAARNTMMATLASTFNPNSGGKPDFNAIGQEALVEKLTDPLARASVALSSDGLRDLVKAMLNYRDTSPRSGVLAGFDDLKNVPGVTPQVINVMKQELSLAPYSVRNFQLVGPKIGAELRNQAVMVTLYALGGMLVYIALRFEWIYGVAAVLAVFHDTLITIGLFSIFNKEIDLTVVAALLTLVGYSMNDTIVIFDRIRENLKVMRKESFPSLVNLSVNQTLSRTVLTSGLTFLSVLCLWLFGGQVLNGFSFALVVGILVGTYSSVFVASPVLIWWYDAVEARKKQKVVVAPSPARETSPSSPVSKTQAPKKDKAKDKSKVAR